MMELNFWSSVSFYLFCGVVVLLTVWYRHFTKDFNYWVNQGVAGEKPCLFIGTLKPIWKKSFQIQDMEATKKYGHVHGGFEGSKPVLFVSDPELIKQVLVKDFHVFPSRRVFESLSKDKVIGKMLTALHGEKWKKIRGTLTPSYTSGKLKQMVPLIEECAKNLNESLKEKSDTGEPIDFTRKFPLLTMEVIASCAFGMKIDCINNPKSEFVTNATNAFKANPVLVYIFLLLSASYKWLPSVLPNQLYYFIDIANKAIDLKLQSPENTRKDFLQIMLESEIPESEVTDKEKNNVKKTLTRDEIVAQTIIFLLAGHETTATLLTLVAYELAVNLKIQETLIEEIDEVMANTKGTLTYESINNMPYLDKIVSETLRKYPPAIRTDRECAEEDYKLNGIILKQGMVVNIPIYSIHHNPEYYPDPDTFNPERFSSENKAKRNPFTYIPFGAGPKNCIAMRFALLEAKIVIIHMLSNYRFQTCEETDFPPKFLATMGLLQPKPIKLLLQKRTDQPYSE